MRLPSFFTASERSAIQQVPAAEVKENLVSITLCLNHASQLGQGPFPGGYVFPVLYCVYV